MTGTALLLILLSVVLHVAWNALGKNVRPSAAFFGVSMIQSALVLTPLLIWKSDQVVPALLTVWPTLVATSCFSAAYNIALAAGYRSGDLSLVYPLARSLGPVGVALVSLLLGRGQEISRGCLLGIAIILAGSLVLPLDRFRELHLDRYRTPAFLAALATALSTTGYTLLDDHALEQLRASLAFDHDTVAASLVYAAMHAWATGCVLALFVVAVPGERRALRDVLTRLRLEALFVGVAGYASYILVLGAMAFVSDVTYVAGFRQLSVPLAAAVGVLWLGDRMSPPRLAGIGLCSLGLLLIAVE